ncbi:type II secretion system F family protein [Halomarina ordinaria]|uniref:Type II secretion system F family protein n=1 Tax=Halomarina ordinaria TaxID=3033939 RepID=A0ABD5UDC2_9EURY|nr:type II secretion system F family protein [Halomarina sp. PSRA2]
MRTDTFGWVTSTDRRRLARRLVPAVAGRSRERYEAVLRALPTDRTLRDVFDRALALGGTGAALVLVAGGLLVPRSAVTVALGAVAVGTLLAVGVCHLPPWVARARRTAALGAAPDLVSRAVLRMRLTPTAETAAAFAARTGRGPLAASLARHVEAARGTPGSGLAAFGERWGEAYPALRRATHLIEAASAAPAGERARALDRATRAVLDGTRERLADATASLSGPLSALYAFGVFLPLALVAVLPAGRAAGVRLTLPVVVALYDVLLPVLTVAACVALLARRPVTFPARPVPRSHPDVPGVRRRAALAFAAVVAGGGSATALAAAVLPVWTLPLAAVGVGSGAALLVWFRPAVAVRRRVRRAEDGLSDALYLVGRRVDEGRSVERAVELAAEEVSGETGDVLARAARRQRQLRVGVREAFLGEHGALARTPSTRLRSTADLLAVAAREGRPAGRAVVSMADHVEELRTVERRSRRELSRLTATLSNTAAAFGPLVAGVTVALAAALDGRSLSAGASTLPTDGLGLAVGAYVLVLACVLTALATGLDRGFDRALVGYRVGGALCSATVVYLAGFAGARLLA